jgi:MYXO-CTERM domain-containing protein
MRTIVVGICLSVGLALAPSVRATTLYNYTTGSGSTSGSVGNSIIESNGGETVTATAWDAVGSGAFAAAALDDYAGTNLGLGVCTEAQLTSNCNAPYHEVNDSGRFDFVLFSFSQPVSSVTIVINPVCDCNTDASYYVNTGSPSGKTLAQLGTATNSNETTADTQRTITISGLNNATSILFGASTSGDNNFFKIGSVSVTEGSVPEPATFGLAGIALVGLGLAGRWRRRQASSR